MLAVVKGILDVESTSDSEMINAAIENLIDGVSTILHNYH